MTPKELFQRLQTTLRALAWPSTANKIFGDAVFIVPELPAQNIADYPHPCCFVQDTGAISYSQHNEILVQNFTVTVFVENFGNRYGESVMMSGNRTANTSSGAGILDIEEQITEQLRKVTVLASAKIVLASKGRVRPALLRKNHPSSYRILSFAALVDNNVVDTIDPDEILRMPGFLYWDPQDLSGTSGLKLGYVADGISFDPGIATVFLTEEDKGSEPTKEVFIGTNCNLIVNLLNYNIASIARMFPGMTVGNRVQIPSGSTTKSGKFLESDIVIASHLLFVPDDSANNFVLLLQKAVPQIIGGFGVRRDTDTMFRIGFRGFRKSNDPDGIFYMGPIANAVLR